MVHFPCFIKYLVDLKESLFFLLLCEAHDEFKKVEKVTKVQEKKKWKEGILMREVDCLQICVEVVVRGLAIV